MKLEATIVGRDVPLDMGVLREILEHVPDRALAGVSDGIKGLAHLLSVELGGQTGDDELVVTLTSDENGARLSVERTGRVLPLVQAYPSAPAPSPAEAEISAMRASGEQADRERIERIAAAAVATANGGKSK